MLMSSTTLSNMQWLELGPKTPSGIVVSAGSNAARYFIFRSRRKNSFATVAVQLDQTLERPAFSIFALDEPTLIMGTWLGEYRVRLGEGTYHVPSPNTCGYLKVARERLWIATTMPNSSLEWICIGDHHNRFANERTIYYPGYTLCARQPNGSRLETYKKELVDNWRAKYQAFNSELNELGAEQDVLSYPLHD